MAIAYLPTPYMHTRYRRRRVLALFSAIALLSTIYFCYRGFDTHTAVPATAQKLLKPTPGGAPESGKPRPLAAIPPMEYGTAARPPLKGIRRLATLPAEHLPKPARGSPRLLVVGDVHGQLAELQALLEQAGFDRARGDHVVFTGDMINKGPDSAGVVALAMEIGASAVRGNHEDKVLLAYANHVQKRDLQAGGGGGGPATKRDTDAKTPAAAAGPETAEEETPLAKGEGPALRTAESLTPAQRDWLAGLPVILRLGHIPNQNTGDWVVVHAGLVPGIAIENQDLHAAMNMRTLTYPARESMREEVRKSLEEQRPAPPPAKEGAPPPPPPPVPEAEVEAALRRAIDALPLAGEVSDFSVAVPTDARTGRPWADVWNRAQAARRLHTERTSVIYGHDARAGLRLGPYAYGLDSGCVAGGRLSALVFEPATSLIGLPVVRHRLVSVPCTKAPGL